MAAAAAPAGTGPEADWVGLALAGAGCTQRGKGSGGGALRQGCPRGAKPRTRDRVPGPCLSQHRHLDGPLGAARMPTVRRVAAAALLVAAVAALAAYAVALRAEDPLSTPAIAAEDPYTHLALTREHLRDGQVEGLDGREPYPPGLHAVLAVLTVHTGIAAFDLVRLGTPFFGAMAVVAAALLLVRLDGRAAAVVGAAAIAVTPELVFRQAMMSPTALDIALVPAVLLGLVETARGRLGWAAPTALLLAFLMLAHPWAFGLVAPAGGLFVVLALVAPWRDAPRLDPAGLALGGVLLGVSSALALSGCWGSCGPGFAQALSPERAALFDRGAVALLVASLVVGAALWLARHAVRPVLARQARWPMPVAWGLGLLLVAGAALLWRHADGIGFPTHVDPATMWGWPLIAAAAVGLAALPLARGPGAHAGAALGLVALPFTLLDPFDSPFWPHRTAAYLAIGFALLAGTGAGAVARGLHRAAAWLAERPATPATTGAPTRTVPRLAVPGLLVGLVVAAGLASAAPLQYPPWYRLFDECEDAALRDVAALADAEPDLVVLTADWQAKLVIAALADNATRVWFDAAPFRDAGKRAGIVGYADGTGHPVLVVVERHALQVPGVNATALADDPRLEPARTWACATPVQAYRIEPR